VESVILVAKPVKEEAKILNVLHATKPFKFLIMENAFVKMVLFKGYFILIYFFHCNLTENLVNDCLTCRDSKRTMHQGKCVC
jgi:hypothetical protein